MTLSWVQIFRLGLVQACLGAIVVLMTSTLNRLMVVELALPVVLPGALVALHYGVQITRPNWGHLADQGGNRTAGLSPVWAFWPLGVLAQRWPFRCWRSVSPLGWRCRCWPMRSSGWGGRFGHIAAGASGHGHGGTQTPCCGDNHMADDDCGNCADGNHGGQVSGPVQPCAPADDRRGDLFGGVCADCSGGLGD